MLPSFEQVYALVSEGVLNEVAGDGGTKFTFAASIVHQRGLPAPAIVVDTKSERLWLHDDCWLAPQSCHGMVANPVTEAILEAMYPDWGARQAALDELWARQCAASWPGLTDGRAGGSADEFRSRVHNYLALGAVPAAARYNVFAGQDVRFYGGKNWETVVGDLGPIPHEERVALIFDLFGRALLDFTLEGQFSQASFHGRNSVRLLRFGWCGTGPNLVNPQLILNRPEEEGLLGQVPDDLIQSFVRNYAQLVDVALGSSRISVATDVVMRAISHFDLTGASEVGPTGTLHAPVREGSLAARVQVGMVQRAIDEHMANEQYE